MRGAREHGQGAVAAVVQDGEVSPGALRPSSMVRILRFFEQRLASES